MWLGQDLRCAVSHIYCFFPGNRENCVLYAVEKLPLQIIEVKKEFFIFSQRRNYFRTFISLYCE